MVLHFLTATFIMGKKLYSDGFYFLILSLTCTIGILTVFLYPHPVVRYILLFIISLVLAIIRKNDIIMVIEIIKRKVGKA